MSNLPAQAVLVLGAHRSGTSLLTHSLIEGGLCGPRNLVPPGEGNADGHWEPLPIVEFNDRVLKDSGARWWSWPHYPKTSTLIASRRHRLCGELKELIIDQYGACRSGKVIVIKDPRICLLYPLYDTALRDLGYTPKALWITRQPDQVISSLIRRSSVWPDLLSWSDAAMIWAQSLLIGELDTQNIDRHFISFEQLCADPDATLDTIATRFALPGLDRQTATAVYKAEHVSSPTDAVPVPSDDVSTALAALLGPIYHAFTRSAVDPVETASLRQRLADTEGIAALSRDRAIVHSLGAPIIDLDMALHHLGSSLEAGVSAQVQLVETRAATVIANLETQRRLLQSTQDQISRATADLRAELAARDEELHHQHRLFDEQLHALAADQRRELLAIRNLMERPSLASAMLRQARTLTDHTAASRFLNYSRRHGPWAAVREASKRSVRFIRWRAALWRNSRPVGQLVPESPSVPKVSVVIPIYDRTDLLREAIQSVLAQSYGNFELLLCLDGSPDDTRAVVAEFSKDPRVRIFSYPRASGNAVRGRNKGILEARGEFISFLDSDDIAHPDRLAISVAALERGYDVVYGAWRAKLDGTRTVDGLADGQVVVSPQCDAEMLARLCVPVQSTVSVRRSILFQHGFLKPCMEYREDHELWARLAHSGARFLALPDVLTTLRLHSGNNELNFKDEDQRWLDLFRHEYERIPDRPLKIVYILASLAVGGGTIVIAQHAAMLQKQGHDVTLVCVGIDETVPAWINTYSIRTLLWRDGIRDQLLNIDLAIATYWTTFFDLPAFGAQINAYLVQSDERLFDDTPANRSKVSQTYSADDVEYICVAPWLARMLAVEFGQDSELVTNGIDLDVFHPHDRPALRTRPLVLLEGNPWNPLKGIADAYSAVEPLDVDILLVSPVPVAEGYGRATIVTDLGPTEMAEIYRRADILVKMSKVESFCLPALEAMACGCAVVASQPKGAIEYLDHEQNALVVNPGDVAACRDQVQRLIDDPGLLERLRRGGLETAAGYSLVQTEQALADSIKQISGRHRDRLAR